MIYDRIENIASYAAVSPMLEAAIASIQATDFAPLSPGTYGVGDSGIYFMIQEPKLALPGECFWEYHEDYADIQFAFSGGLERIGFASRDDIPQWIHKEGTDTFISHSDMSGLELAMREGWFAAFFPQDAHRPCIGKTDADGYRKIVYKIPIKETANF